MLRYITCTSIILITATSLNAQKVLHAIKTETTIIIDGEIDSVLFALPNSASGFIQMEPSPGSPSVENTIVYVMYDEKAVYVVFKCFHDQVNVVSQPSVFFTDYSCIKLCFFSLFNLLLASVRSADRTLMQKYIGEIAMKRFTAGFEAKEMTDAIATFGKVITETLLTKKDLGILKQEIYDYIGLTLQLAMDEVEDVFENMDKRISKEKLALLTKQRDAEREKEIKSLSAFYQEYPEKDQINVSTPE